MTESDVERRHREDERDADARPHGVGRVLNRGQRLLIDDLAEAGIPARQVAIKAGLSTPSTLSNFTSGRSARLAPSTAARVAIALNVPDHACVYAGLEPIEADADNLSLAEEVVRSWASPAPEPPRMVELRMEAAAGLWSERTSIPAGSREVVALPPGSPCDNDHLFAVRVRNGAEERYPDGTLLICRTLVRPAETLRPGARVVVRRSRNFRANEVTIRQLDVVGGAAYLSPLGAGQEVLRSPWPYDGRFVGPQGRITILGAVVAAFVWEED